MTRRAPFLVLSIVTLAACRTATTESSTNVPVGAVPPQGEPLGEATANDLGERTKPAGSCGLRATIREIDRGFVIDLKNEGQKPVKLILPGDGSTVGWRTPVLTWVATSNGKAAPYESEGRCGMMNPLKVEEVFTLEPGQTKTLQEWTNPNPFVDGTYEVKVTYKNDPSIAKREGKGKATDAEVARAFASTNACEVTSNALTVTFKNAR